nr:hypothetical protein [Limobrevibacterium gyesilva]
MLAGCQKTTQQQTEALTLGADAPALRQQQTRRFDTADDKLLLNASVGVLQDLGFQIDEATAGAGLVIGSKDRDAIEAGQVVGQVLLAALLAAGGVATVPVYDRSQRIRVSIITRLAPDRTGAVVRVTFQRVVRDNMNRVAHVDTLQEPAIYRAFFDKLSQAAFLEAHEI